MVGGIIEEILHRDSGYLIKVVDKSDSCWRHIDKNKKTRCISTGDRIWWQNHVGYWTPAESEEAQDIDIGKCLLTKDPRQKVK